MRVLVSRLAPSLREFRPASVATIVLAVVEVLAEISIPFLTASLIDQGIERGDQALVDKMGLLLACLAIVALAAGMGAGRLSARAGAGLARNLRSDQFTSIQRFSFANIDRFSEGSLITRLTTDVTNVQMAYMMIIRIAVRAPATLVFALVMSFVVDPTLASVFLAVIPFLGAALAFIALHAHPIFERVFRTYDRLNTQVQEDIRGIRVVKAFVRGAHEEAGFRTTSDTIKRDFTAAERILAFNQPAMQLAIYTCLLLVAWIGAHQIVSGTLTTGELVSVISYAMQILISLMMLSMVLVMATISRASTHRIGEVLVERPLVGPPAQPVTTVVDASVRLSAVNFSYGHAQSEDVLHHVDLTISPGQTIGLLGGTGSGKSSLVQLIPRLYDVTSGSVEVGGVDVRDYDLATLRDAVGIVLQKNVLFEGTVAENLRWGDPDASDEQLWAAADAAQASEFLTALPDGLESRVEQGGMNFSGGQRQRLCVARTLLKRPKVLILDDSTSAVDTATESRMSAGLRRALPATTTIIIAQRVSSVRDADLIVMLAAGRVLAQGTHDHLMRDCPDYRDLFLSQNARTRSDG